MTIQEAARNALGVQNGCNLSGIVLEFGTVLTEVIWPEARRLNQGTFWVNQHPISRAYADKIASLSGIQESSNLVFRAFDECEALAAGGPSKVEEVQG